MPYTKDRSFQARYDCFGKHDKNPIAVYRPYSIYPKSAWWRRFRAGNVNPKWKQQVEDHQNATTSLNATYSTIDSKKGYLTISGDQGVDGDTTLHVEGHLAMYTLAEFGWVGGWTSNAESKASIKFHQAVRETQHKMAGMVFAKEFGQVVRMFTRPLEGLERGINDYLRQVRRLNRENRKRYFTKKPKKYARNLTQIAGNTWLENAFGLQPFLQDLEDSRAAYNSLFDKERVVAVSGGGVDFKDFGMTTVSEPVLIPAQNSNWCFTNTGWTEHHIVRFYGQVLAQAATTASDRAARYGFSFSEFIPTAWEILPWSFLIDYYANIGGMLEALVTDTANVRWSTRTEIRRSEKVRTVVPDYARIKSTWSASGWKLYSAHGRPSIATWSRREISRSISGVPYPGVVFRIPSAETQAKKLLNIVALLASVGLDTHPQRIRGSYRL